MDQKFSERLASAGWNREKLLLLLRELDNEKNSLKIALRRVAQDPEYSMVGMGRDRQNKERRIKEKQRYLIEERQVVQQRIGKINREIKGFNRVRYGSKEGFAAAFVAAAEELLSEDIIIEIEQRAVLILENFD